MSRLHNAAKDRCFWVILAASVAIGAVAYMRGSPPNTAALSKGDFLARKAFAPVGAYNVVILGDSRTLDGVSPKVLSETSGIPHAFNFAFAGAGLSPVVFDAATKLLPRRGTRIILIGATPIALSRDLAENRPFLYIKSHPEWRRGRAAAFTDRFDSFMASRFPELVQDEVDGLRFVYHDDGWREAVVDGDHPLWRVSQFKKCAKDFAANPVDAKVVEEMLAAVARWTRSGVRVCAFSPPTCAEMLALERDVARYDPDAFRAAFLDAGGTWIDLDGDYQTYDGSHLNGEGARKLSAELGANLARPMHSRKGDTP